MDSANPVAEEDRVLPIPNLRLPEAVFILAEPKAQSLHEKARETLLKGIEADGETQSLVRILTKKMLISLVPPLEMAPYLIALTSSPSSSVIPLDAALLARLQAKNVEELAKLDAKLDDAEKNLGESEISEALRAKALYLARIGDKVWSHLFGQVAPLVTDHLTVSGRFCESS